jgi:NADH dehydrogenase
VNVLVAGGTGFVGRRLCSVLEGRDYDVTAASRSPDGSDLPDTVDTIAADVTDPELDSLVAGFDVVVNLVALPSHIDPKEQRHRDAHLAGTRNLVAASERTGVDRLLQMSALGVDSGVSTDYFEAKRGAERCVRESSLDWVIYRPSVIFGDGCAFLPFLDRLATARVVPLPDGGDLRLQPIWIGDLAPMLADGVESDRHVGATYELGGPERITLREVVKMVREDAVIVPIPGPLAAVGSVIAGTITGVPIGADQYRVFQLDNTVSNEDLAAFGVSEDELRTLEAYLS